MAVTVRGHVTLNGEIYRDDDAWIDGCRNCTCSVSLCIGQERMTKFCLGGNLNKRLVFELQAQGPFTMTAIFSDKQLEVILFSNS